ncbi:MAG: MMPL family transporter, partial [Planctomycetales bacterium]|nr:MMPL family transporter [Planctomycetales bacterium]
MQHRRYRLLWIYAVLLMPAVGFEAAKALKGAVNVPLEWASADDPVQKRYHEFVQAFGSGDILLVSWNGCHVDLPELDQVVADLHSNTDFYQAGNWLFDRIESGRHAVQQLTRSGVTSEQAVQRLDGILIGPDRQTTCVVIAFTPSGVLERAALLPKIQDVITKRTGVPAEQQHLVGPIIDGLSADLASQATVQSLAPISTAVVLVLAIVCLRSWRESLLVFAVSVYCQLVTMALVSACGESISALLVVLPPLIQVLSLAGGIHLVNYFRESIRTSHATVAAERTLQIGWLPCVLSSATTAIGMASLLVSDLEPIRQFGAFSAAGVLLTTAILLVAVPALLARFTSSARSTSHTPVESTQTLWSPITQRLATIKLPVIAVSLVTMVAAVFGMQQLNSSVRIETLFASDSRILQDYDWFEQHVGPVVPVEVLLKIDVRNQHWQNRWPELVGY